MCVCVLNQRRRGLNELLPWCREEPREGKPDSASAATVPSRPMARASHKCECVICAADKERLFSWLCGECVVLASPICSKSCRMVGAQNKTSPHLLHSHFTMKKSKIRKAKNLAPFSLFFISFVSIILTTPLCSSVISSSPFFSVQGFLLDSPVARHTHTHNHI